MTFRRLSCWVFRDSWTPLRQTYVELVKLQRGTTPIASLEVFMVTLNISFTISFILADRNSEPHYLVHAAKEAEAREGKVPLGFTRMELGSVPPQTQSLSSSSGLVPGAPLGTRVLDTDQLCPQRGRFISGLSLPSVHHGKLCKSLSSLNLSFLTVLCA